MTTTQTADLNRIEVNPNVLVGKPVVRGTRIPVSLILNYLAHGLMAADLIADFPILTEEDIAAAVAYADQEQMRTEVRTW